MKLTDKEFRILTELCSGKLPQEVADATGSSLKTIRNQINELHKKFNINATYQLLSLVFRSNNSDHLELRINKCIDGLVDG